MARSSVRRYTAASSLVSKPTITFGSICGGRRLSTASRTLGLNFAAQPAAFAVVVSRTCSANVISPWNRLHDYSAGAVVDCVRKARRNRAVKIAFGLCVRCGRTDRNGDGLSGLCCGEHVAAPVEDGARFHDEAGRMDFAGDDGFGLNFDFAGGLYGAVEMAADNYVVAFNLAFDFGMLAEDQGFVGNQRAFHHRINAKGAGTFQTALELDALVQKAGPLPGIMPFAVKPTHALSPRYANSVTLSSHELVVEACQITIVVVLKH